MKAIPIILILFTLSCASGINSFRWDESLLETSNVIMEYQRRTNPRTIMENTQYFLLDRNGDGFSDCKVWFDILCTDGIRNYKKMYPRRVIIDLDYDGEWDYDINEWENGKPVNPRPMRQRKSVMEYIPFLIPLIGIGIRTKRSKGK